MIQLLSACMQQQQGLRSHVKVRVSCNRIKRAASQPSLAGLPSALGVPSIVKAAEALVSRSEGSASSSRGAPAAASSNGALDSSLRSDSPG